MTLTKNTELGTISISNIIFAEIIKDSFNLIECKGKVWPANKKGKQIGNDTKFNINDFASNIEVTVNENGKVDMEFNIIIKFGTSIKFLTKIIFDYIVEAVSDYQGEKPNQIKIRITGVKSKQIAKRNLEVVREYGTV